jgi:AraC-like DNA-binding protein
MVPGQVHAFTGQSPEGYVMIFSREFLDDIGDDRFRMLFNPFVSEALEVVGETAEVLEGIVRLMMAENRGSGDMRILHAYMKAFLLQLARVDGRAAFPFDRGGRRMRDLFELLEGSYRAERQAGYYASRLGVTPKRLNEILRQRFGSTLTQLLHDRLVLEAKREIAYGRKSMKEISFELGFSDQAYFSRFFKARTGMTPESFRHRMVETA